MTSPGFPPSHTSLKSSGFSLVELLVVIAIIGMLSTLAVRVFPAFGSANGVTSATETLRGAVELARSRSKVTGMWHWVGVRPDGSGHLAVRIYRAKNNIGTSLLAEREGKEYSFQAVKLSPVVGAYQSARPAADAKLTPTQADAGFWLAVAPSGEIRLDSNSPLWSGQGNALTFSAPPSALECRIEIGIVPVFGTGNSAVLQIAGLNGQTKVYRP